MPDIMCHGGDCPVKDVCKRHTDTPNKFAQLYYQTPPFYYSPIILNEPVLCCDYFVRNDEK